MSAPPIYPPPPWPCFGIGRTIKPFVSSPFFALPPIFQSYVMAIALLQDLCSRFRFFPNLIFEARRASAGSLLCAAASFFALDETPSIGKKSGTLPAPTNPVSLNPPAFSDERRPFDSSDRFFPPLRFFVQLPHHSDVPPSLVFGLPAIVRCPAFSCPPTQVCLPRIRTFVEDAFLFLYTSPHRVYPGSRRRLQTPPPSLTLRRFMVFASLRPSTLRVRKSPRPSLVSGLIL